MVKKGKPPRYKIPDKMNIGKMPSEMRHLWEWFVAIKNSGEVTPIQIQAYFDLIGVDPKPDDVRAILMLDAVSRKDD